MKLGSGTLIIIVLLGLMLGAVSCTTTQRGALLGSALGAGTGAIIGHQSGHAGEGALIGAGVGALTGALLGDFIEHYEIRKRDPYQAPPSYNDYGYYNDW